MIQQWEPFLYFVAPQQISTKQKNESTKKIKVCSTDATVTTLSKNRWSENLQASRVYSKR